MIWSHKRTINLNSATTAKSKDFDVVLIDTAGRMQDNEPLMRSLAKLVAVNNPDKIIFVGEALVGNEAVDQLTKFNQALKDFSGLQNPRHIDGMILTKFDTIDDKVIGKKVLQCANECISHISYSRSVLLSL
jgi:signal recognition particle receptor subunit alpha